MIFYTKDGKPVGQAGECGQKVRKEVVSEFLKALGGMEEVIEKTDDKHLKFTGELDDKIIRIKLKRGSWDIMESIVPMILKYCPGDIVEIGMGESSEMFAKYAVEFGVNLYSCDIQMGGMFEVFDKELFANHRCFIGRSEDFLKEYGGSPSIVFIDGEHLYETVKLETEFFLPKIRTGGVMFLHDTMPVLKKNIERDGKGYNPGDIYKVRQELERMPEYDVFTWPYSAQDMGLTMVMIHGNGRSNWRENGRNVGGDDEVNQ